MSLPQKRRIRKTITKTPAIIDHGRAMHPVVRAAFKAVELLIKWLEGSTPSSSATYIHNLLFLINFLFLFFISLTLGLTANSAD